MESYSTPFYQEPLVNLFGYMGNQEQVEEVMPGAFQTPDNVDQYTCLFFDHVRRPERVSNAPIVGQDFLCKVFVEVGKQQGKIQQHAPKAHIMVNVKRLCVAAKFWKSNGPSLQYH